MAFIFVLLFFASAIIKWYVNNYGESLVGRKLHLNELSINYFTVSVDLGGFTMYEADKKDTFVNLGSAYVNINPWYLLAGKYDVTEIALDRLKLQIIQKDSTFNFSDLLSDEPADTTAAPTKFYLSNVKITAKLAFAIGEKGKVGIDFTLDNKKTGICCQSGFKQFRSEFG